MGGGRHRGGACGNLIECHAGLGFDLFRHPDQCGALLLIRVQALCVLRLGQAAVLDGIRPEHLKGRRHPADLVLAPAAGDLDVLVARGEALHRLRHRRS